MADVAVQRPPYRVRAAVPASILGGFAGVLVAPAHGAIVIVFALAGGLCGIGLAAALAKFRAASLRRQLVVAAIVVVLAIAARWRWQREAIPGFESGFLAFFPPVEGPTLTSPSGRHSVRVIFHDAGAAHSGNHRTKLMDWDWLTGNRVIAEGYSTPDVEHGDVPFPLTWIDDRTFRVEFVDGRRSAKPKYVVARVRD
ncbi:MAG TPA: hypothetical protein VG406_19590 [Isosphaeraceae bacterium]|jgi:hypothetical protein|nr:hypothetical protein [Isosphaeraceae bacterium]